MHPIVNLLRFFHLTLAATWAGSYIANLFIAGGSHGDAALARARISRRLLLRLEMPLAALVPGLGFALSGFKPYLWSQGWLHTKATAFVVIFVLLILESRRNRFLTEALHSGDDEAASRHRRAFLLLRTVGVVAFIVIFFCVVYRFGVKTPI